MATTPIRSVPRKLKLSPEQGAVLRLLEEAGSDTIGAVLNTLKVIPALGGSVPADFRTAIEEMLRLGLVQWATPGDDPMADVEHVSAEGWRARGDSGVTAELVLTREGSEALAR